MSVDHNSNTSTTMATRQYSVKMSLDSQRSNATSIGHSKNTSTTTSTRQFNVNVLLERHSIIAVSTKFFSVSSPRPHLVGEDLISVLFFHNSEPRPDEAVVGLSCKRNLELSCKIEGIDPRRENL